MLLEQLSQMKSIDSEKHEVKRPTDMQTWSHHEK